MIFANAGTGLVGVLLLFTLLIAGLRIGAALGLVGLGGMMLILGVEPALYKSGVVAIDTLTRYELGTLPLFILMAQLFFAADASRDLFDAAAKFMGHRRGGLAYAAIGGCCGLRRDQRVQPGDRRHDRPGRPARKCASAAIPTRSPPARSLRAARWAR